ncbi:hypothetical protein QV09_11135 [Gallibacterium salpingitidis]|uniref:Uncharacterized protein n=1 Tax=Gallibacterium salpingitidis TaxID=505341 RepID=A0AB36E450_9PAST|nr:hypothetical protein [Gallibacterium salpingitidis]OBX07407.1 hypothetical protein QV09_11135 [Gallibacterium salpingitidis]
MKVELELKEFELLFIAHLRYCLGRQSYMVLVGQDNVKKYWSILSNNAKNTIKHDISEHLHIISTIKDPDLKKYFELEEKTWKELYYWCEQQENTIT